MPSADHHSRACPTEATLAVIGGRWKVPILWNLLAGKSRFGELSRKLPGASQKMLTQQLRELEQDGLILRSVLGQVPPHVEYSLSEPGRAFLPLLHAMNKWGQHHLLPRCDVRFVSSGEQDNLSVET